MDARHTFTADTTPVNMTAPWWSRNSVPSTEPEWMQRARRAAYMPDEEGTDWREAAADRAAYQHVVRP